METFVDFECYIDFVLDIVLQDVAQRAADPDQQTVVADIVLDRDL